MREAVGADVAITNGGGIRADREYPAGTKLTRGDILAELPFGNKTVKLEVTGARHPRRARERLQPDRERRPAASRRSPGLTVEVDPDQPGRRRVVSVMVGGAPLDDAKTYTLATNDFMANGGDGYAVFKGGQAADRPDRRDADGDPGDRLHRREGDDRADARGPHRHRVDRGRHRTARRAPVSSHTVDDPGGGRRRCGSHAGSGWLPPSRFVAPAEDDAVASRETCTGTFRPSR